MRRSTEKMIALQFLTVILAVSGLLLAQLTVRHAPRSRHLRACTGLAQYRRRASLTRGTP